MNGEGAFIRHLGEVLPGSPVDEVWIGDDAAVLADGTLLAIDTLVDGVHFDLRWTAPRDVGWKTVAVNLSDLAAMGGSPTAAVLAVALPAEPSGLAAALVDGAVAAATEFGCPLVGGDTTSGPTLVTTAAVLGASPPGGAVLRSGARPGDSVFVTGDLGGPRRAVAVLQGGGEPDDAAARRLHRPAPRLECGEAAAAAGATSMIDLSDGLGTDLGHICDASGVGIRLDAASVPVAQGAAFADAVAGGDDYELCFTANDVDAVAEAFLRRGLDAPARIGTIVEDPDQRVVTDGESESPLEAGGWEHRVS